MQTNVTRRDLLRTGIAGSCGALAATTALVQTAGSHIAMAQTEARTKLGTLKITKERPKNNFRFCGMVNYRSGSGGL